MPAQLKTIRPVAVAPASRQTKSTIRNKQQVKTSKQQQMPIKSSKKDSKQVAQTERNKQLPPKESQRQQDGITKQQQLTLRALLLAAVASTCVGFCLVAAMLLHYRSRSSLQRQLPPNVSIPATQLANYDNGTFTSNWRHLDECIRRLNCPPTFFACQATEVQLGDGQKSLTGNDLAAPVYLWHHFLLLGWALFTCHQAAGMRQLFQPPSGGQID